LHLYAGKILPADKIHRLGVVPDQVEGKNLASIPERDEVEDDQKDSEVVESSDSGSSDDDEWANREDGNESEQMMVITSEVRPETGKPSQYYFAVSFARLTRVYFQHSCSTRDYWH